MPIALIADLVNSRESPRRDEVQRRLRAALEELNRELGPAVLGAPFTLTAGDEVQALLRDGPGAARAVDAIVAITDRLAALDEPQAVAFGVGRGALSTGALPAPPAMAETPATLDGACFHAARAALERASARRGWAAFEGFGARGDSVLDALFELMGSIRGRWTPTQHAITVDMRGVDQQKEVAQQRGVSPSVISESLKAASYFAVREGEQAARLALELALEREVEP